MTKDIVHSVFTDNVLLPNKDDLIDLLDNIKEPYYHINDDLTVMVSQTGNEEKYIVLKENRYENKTAQSIPITSNTVLLKAEMNTLLQTAETNSTLNGLTYRLFCIAEDYVSRIACYEEVSNNNYFIKFINTPYREKGGATVTATWASRRRGVKVDVTIDIHHETQKSTLTRSIHLLQES